RAQPAGLCRLPRCHAGRDGARAAGLAGRPGRDQRRGRQEAGCLRARDPARAGSLIDPRQGRSRGMSPCLRRPGLARAARALAATARVGAGGAGAEDAPAVTPYRPSVSTPAALSAPGWLEVEAGLQADRDRAADARRTSLPYTLKLAMTPDWGIRIG